MTIQSDYEAKITHRKFLKEDHRIHSCTVLYFGGVGLLAMPSPLWLVEDLGTKFDQRFVVLTTTQLSHNREMTVKKCQTI